MIKKICMVLFAVFFAPTVTFSQNLIIDEAVSESVKYFSTKLKAGTKVIVLNIESESKNLSDYIIEEINASIMNGTKLSPVINRSGLSNVLKEKNINDLNEIDESIAVQIGKELSTSSVILGSVSKLGEIYRFRVQALNSADGQVLGIQSFNVKQDEILADLTKTGAPSAAKPAPQTPVAKQDAEFDDLSNLRSNAALGDSQSARARLEAEMDNRGGGGKNVSAQNAKTSEEKANLFIINKQKRRNYDLFINDGIIVENRQPKRYDTLELSMPVGMYEIVAKTRWEKSSVSKPSYFRTAKKLIKIDGGKKYFVTMDDYGKNGRFVISDNIYTANFLYTPANVPTIVRIPVLAKDERKSYLSLGVKFQRFNNYYPSDSSYYYSNSYYSPNYLYPYKEDNVFPGSFNLEIGGIKKSGYTIIGLNDWGPGLFGMGVFLGGTTLKSKIFRFRGGVDLGAWMINTQTLEEGYSSQSVRITYGRVRENIMYGGPHFNFLLGYNPVYFSFAFKTYFGNYYEYDMKRWHDNGGSYGLDYKTGFTAMPSWNIGLTFTF
jgi:hypothetical protein